MNDNNDVRIVDFRMSFVSMVCFMVKWTIASIPAILILGMMLAALVVIVRGVVGI